MASIVSFSFCHRPLSAGARSLRLGQLLLDPLQPLLRGRVLLLPQRLALDLELEDPALELVDLLGQAVDLDADARGRLVDEVDGLVRQIPAR